MNITEVKSDILNDKYYRLKHSSGLTIFVYPRKDYVSTYAVMGTKFGSLNIEFNYNGKHEKMPIGTAHFLEHKMFECEDGDSFELFSQLGANANAYTSFDKTCYLFSCTQDYEKSLEILFNLVTRPYFTDETVAKEQGIIGQEIKMYEDNPDWRITFNLLDAMYHNNGVKHSITGTVESIAQITPQMLYTCYDGFYNLQNMVLCIAGNADVEVISKLADKCLKDAPIECAAPIFPDEPNSVREKYTQETFSISMPLFQLGFKENPKKPLSEKQLAYTDILLYLLSSNTSHLYEELINDELINTTFGYEHFEGIGYSGVIFSGETSNPELTAQKIKDAIVRMKKMPIDEKELSIAKKALYGSTIASFNSVDNIANTLVDFALNNRELFTYLKELINTTPEDIKNRLNEQLDVDNCSLSVMLPKKERNE